MLIALTVVRAGIRIWEKDNLTDLTRRAYKKEGRQGGRSFGKWKRQKSENRWSSMPLIKTKTLNLNNDYLFGGAVNISVSFILVFHN